ALDIGRSGVAQNRRRPLIVPISLKRNMVIGDPLDELERAGSHGMTAEVLIAVLFHPSGRDHPVVQACRIEERSPRTLQVDLHRRRINDLGMVIEAYGAPAATAGQAGVV